MITHEEAFSDEFIELLNSQDRKKVIKNLLIYRKNLNKIFLDTASELNAEYDLKQYGYVRDFN